MTTIRASKLSLALACPASLAPPEFALASDSAEARLGSAVHQVLAALVRGEDWQERIAPAAAEWRVAVEDVERLSWAGQRAWDRLACQFPEPMVEAEVVAGRGDWTLTGHPDAYSFVGAELRLLDWKTGFADEDHEQQLRGYAWILLRCVREMSSATAVVVRLREMTQDVYRWSREELDAWFAGVVRDTADLSRYGPGRGCSFCPRRLGCQARIRHVADSVAAVAHHEAAPLARHWPDVLLAVYDRVKLVKAACERAGDVLDAEVGAAGGAVTGSDGRTLALVAQHRREIKAERAWDTLRQRFNEGELLSTVTIRKGKSKAGEPGVEELAKARAPHRGKGAAAKQLMDDLDAAGAIVTTTTQRLEVSRNGNGTSTADVPALAARNGDGPGE